MLDDRDFSWMGRAAAATPAYPEHVIWRVEKDTRWAEARVRDVPHGAELRFMVGGQGRDDVLMQSTVYRGSDDPALHTMSEGTRQNFVGHGWTLVS
jgi:hypothetical protein